MVVIKRLATECNNSSQSPCNLFFDFAFFCFVSETSVKYEYGTAPIDKAPPGISYSKRIVTARLVV